MKPRPQSGGVCLKKSSNASNPPAEAPTPTTGNARRSAGEGLGGVRLRVPVEAGVGEAAAGFFFKWEMGPGWGRSGSGDSWGAHLPLS